jgi:hypothetical protein
MNDIIFIHKKFPQVEISLSQIKEFGNKELTLTECVGYEPEDIICYKYNYYDIPLSDDFNPILKDNDLTISELRSIIGFIVNDVITLDPYYINIREKIERKIQNKIKVGDID